MGGNNLFNNLIYTQMKKILSLVLLCATVLFTSCKDDDDNNKQDDGTPGDTPGAYTGPDFKMYGQKNRRLAYYDGKELKFLTEDYGSVSFGGVDGDDLYAASYDGQSFYKNGEIAAKDGKLPSSIGRISDFQIVDRVFYVAGGDKDNNSKPAIWKNGQKVFNSDKSGSIEFCILGNDIFSAVWYSENSSSHIQFYKNDVLLPTTVDGAYIGGVQAYNNKAYILLTAGSDLKRYVYDGTSTDVTQDITLPNTQNSYFGISGNSLFTALETGDALSIYKNLDWTTPLPALAIPESTTKFDWLREIVEKGNDVYTYGVCGTAQSNKYEAYVWRNSADPIRLPMDTVNVIYQIK